jgi:DNA invertase Pin-like site-specific DNA recombinase
LNYFAVNRQIFGAIAEYERAMIVLKLRAARQRKRAKNGRCEGRKPFGAREGERSIIKHMQKLRDTGMALVKIADKLNEDHVPTRTGKPWHAMTVSRILRAHSW